MEFTFFPNIALSLSYKSLSLSLSLSNTHKHTAMHRLTLKHFFHHQCEFIYQMQSLGVAAEHLRNMPLNQLTVGDGIQSLL